MSSEIKIYYDDEETPVRGVDHYGKPIITPRTTTDFAMEHMEKEGAERRDQIRKTGLVLVELPIGDKEDDPKIICERLQFYFDVHFLSSELADLSPRQRLNFIKDRIVEAMTRHMIGDMELNPAKVQRELFLYPVDRKILGKYLRIMDYGWARDALARSVALDDIYDEIKNISDVEEAMKK